MSDFKNIRMRLHSIAVLALTLIFSISMNAQVDKISNVWKESTTLSTTKDKVKQNLPITFKVFKFDYLKLQAKFKSAPAEFNNERSKSLQIELPLPNGNLETFDMYKTDLLPKKLNKKYPSIQTYSGHATDDFSKKIKIDFGYNGLHVQILSENEGTIYLEPIYKNDFDAVMCFYKNDVSKTRDFECNVLDKVKKEDHNDGLNKRAGDCQLRIYRLALACTYEYANFHGGNTANVLSEMVTTMNRVNGLFERDASLRMQFVEDNDQLVFTDPNDPYSNNNAGAMLSENQTTCDNVIGSANYDIGHVFGTSGGGLAYLNAPCGGNKAGGMTGLGNPTGDYFAVDYVSHEMGHQFGATHTFNNSCGGNRTNSTAMEPGSGSTIMGYAGICGPNVQNTSNDHFHGISIQQMAIFTNNSSCPEVLDLGNNHPIVEPFQNEIIPHSTPFELTAVASDPDGDLLTYCWEQFDNEIADMPPMPTNTDGPMFRSLSPTGNPTRVFPNLNDLLNNVSPEWEVLPSVARGMNFRCSVRDNNSSNGCVEEEDAFVNVAGTAGPFLVMMPNTDVTWMVGERQMVTWDVANTNASPVSCEQVDLLLSIDGGYTYPFILAENIDNSGSFEVEVPNQVSPECRVKVKGTGRIFFDVSNENFEIELPPVPTFLMDVDPSSKSICASEGQVDFTISTQAVAGFDEMIEFTVAGLPSGANASFMPSTLSGNGETVLSISSLEAIESGAYTLSLTGSSTSVTQSSEILLNIYQGFPDVSMLMNPPNLSTAQSSSPEFTWEEFSGAQSYVLEVSNSPSFTAESIISVQEVNNPAFQGVQLAESTVYFWRVKASNLCGEGGYSDVFSFQTAGTSCNIYSNNTPIQIIASEESIINSVINVSDDYIITDVNVVMEIEHTWVGDLVGKLQNPSGSEITLFDQAGVPENQYGCDRDNLNVGFDDEAIATKEDFEETCDQGDYAISGTYQTNLGNLFYFDNRSSTGDWTLIIEDKVAEDGGQLLNWNIEICIENSESPNVGATQMSNNALTVPFSLENTLMTSNLQFTKDGLDPSAISYLLTSLPVSGVLSKEGTAMEIGESFTQTDVDENKISYEHQGDDATSDSFNFDVLDSEGGWSPGNVFQIVIVQNTLAATASSNNVSCFGFNNGSIVVSVNGGTPTYQYSIDGENFQNENTFDNLSPGTYMITVKDADEFTVLTSEVTIIEPSVLVISSSVNMNQITAEASGGTGAYTYNINGGTNQASNVFANLANGTYIINVQDENGCVASIETTVLVNTLNAAVANLVQNISCFNFNDGSLTVMVEGGSSPYEYSLNDGSFQDSPSFENLSEGMYICQVRDADGFIIESNSITITNPQAISGTLEVSARDLEVIVTGGTGALSYSLDNVSFQDSNLFENLPNGTYTVYVKDTNGCLETFEATIFENSFVSANLNLVSLIDCNGATTGEISVIVEGGTAPLSYSLNDGDYQESNFFNMLGAGSYMVNVRDADGFIISTNTLTLIDPVLIEVSNVVTDNMVEVMATGGTGTLQYSLDGINFQNDNIFAGLINGDYLIFVKDANGCIEEDNFTILFDNLTAQVSIVNQVSCAGDEDGSIMIQVSGGTAPYTYSIDGENFQESNIFMNLAAGIYQIIVKDNFNLEVSTNSIELIAPLPVGAMAVVNENIIFIEANGGTGTYMYSIDGLEFQTSNEFSGLPNGEYTFTIMDANGCSITTTATVAVNSLSASISQVQEVSCYNESDASLFVEVSGGEMPYMYSIDGENFQDQPLFTGLGAGEYQVKVKDAFGFEISTNTITIVNPDPIVLTATSTETTVLLMATGGTGTYEFSDNGINYLAANVFENLEIGSYTFYVKDGNGCVESIDVEVIFNDIFAISSISQGISCKGEMDAAIVVEVSGGTNPKEFSLDGENWQAENRFENLGAGEFQVIVRDANGYIFTTELLVINEPDALQMELMVNDNIITATASGGTGIITYSIDGENFQSSNTFESLINGSYTIIAMDMNGCSIESSAEVSVNTLLAQATVTEEIACHGELTSISIAVSGGKEPYEYSLDGEMFQDSNEFAMLGAGTYEVTVRDADGFDFTIEQIVIEQPEELLLTIETSDFTIEATASGGTGTLLFSMDGNEYSDLSIFTGLPNGDYIIYVKDENDCVISQTVQLNSMPIISIAVLETQDLLCHGDENGLINVEATGGLAPYQYSIDGENYFDSGLFENLPGGEYTVSVQDVNGAMSMLMITIMEPNPILLTVEVVEDEIEIKANGGTGMYQYSIDGGVTYQDASIFLELTNGLYMAGAIDENGCTNFVEVQVSFTSVDYVNDVWQLSSFPNPTSDFLNVSSTGGLDLKDLNLELLSIDGRILMVEQIAKNDRVQLNMSPLPNGTYLLKINDGANVGVVRIVKQ